MAVVTVKQATLKLKSNLHRHLNEGVAQKGNVSSQWAKQRVLKVSFHG